MKVGISKNRFGWSRNDEGLAIFFKNRSAFQKAADGKGPNWASDAFSLMIGLLESGEAKARESTDGIFIETDDAVRLDSETRETFDLPHPWPGHLRLECRSVPNLPDFDAALRVISPQGQTMKPWSLDGPILDAGDKEHYLPTSPQFACLKAFTNWSESGESGEKSEVQNLRFLHTLQEAAETGCRIDLQAVSGIDIVDAEECLVDVTENPDGSLLLTPLFNGLFSDDELESARGPSQLRELITQRLHHLDGNDPEAIIRIGKQIVLLNPTQNRASQDDQERPGSATEPARHLSPRSHSMALRPSLRSWGS